VLVLKYCQHNMEKQPKTNVKKPIGRYWAFGFAVISLFAGLNIKKDGGNINQANDYFLSTALIMAGIGLFTLGKKAFVG